MDLIKKTAFLLFLAFALISLSACSANTLLKHGPAIGGVTGGVSGMLLGDRIGDNLGDADMGAVIGAGAGALGGLVAGHQIQEQKKDQLAESLPPKRVPIMTDNTSRQELERAQQEIKESTDYGRGEVNSWEERYLDYEPSYPYQGSHY